MVLALQSGTTLDQFGARSVVGRLVAASMVKELGPALTALMVTGRVGSGIAAELGSMVVTDQIAALRSLGTDPVRKLVIPRVLAGTIMVPILTIIADGVGIIGGMVDLGDPAEGRVDHLLEQRHWRPLRERHLDGAPQACRPGLRADDDRLPRRLRTTGGTQGSAAPPPMPSSAPRSSSWRSISCSPNC